MANLNSKTEDEIIDMKTLNTGENKSQVHSHAKHMWMMAICCGLPIIGFIVIGAIGISMPSLETLFLIICPIGMIGMMYMMHRDSQGKRNACCDSEKSVEEPIEGNNNEAIGGGGSKQALSKPQQSGSLEA